MQGDVFHSLWSKLLVRILKYPKSHIKFLLKNFSIKPSKIRKRRLSFLPIEDQLFGLTEEEQNLRYTLRRFFEEQIPPKMRQMFVFYNFVEVLENFPRIDESESFPQHRDFMKHCGKMGILGALSAEEYGGSNLGIFRIGWRDLST